MSTTLFLTSEIGWNVLYRFNTSLGTSFTYTAVGSATLFSLKWFIIPFDIGLHLEG